MGPGISEEAKPAFPHLPFRPDEFYSPKAVADKGIAAEQTLATWRHLKKGPAYIKVGSRVLYPGNAMLEFLNENLVENQAA